MSKKITVDGQEIEVFTKEELDEKVVASTAEATQKVKDELEATKKELEKLNNKDMNFSKARKETEEERAKREALEGEITRLQAMIQTSVKDALTKDAQDRLNKVAAGAISEYAGNDKELKEKIEYHFKRISDSPMDEAGMIKKVEDAVQLATGVVAGGNGNPFSSAAAGRKVFASGSGDKVPQHLKTVGTRFGLSDADWEKYDKKN